MKKENKKEIEAKLRDFFAMQDIKLAFLIGSYAMGTARPDSDVDIAVLFGQKNYRIDSAISPNYRSYE